MEKPMTPAAMSTESADARFARLEAARDEHRDQLRMLTPLIAQYAVMEERVGNFGEDLNEGLKAIRAELAEVKEDRAARAKERRAMLFALVLAGIGLVGTFGAQLLQLRGGR